MTKTRMLMLLAGGLATGALSGCGADVPANPSWVADVHPIMVARCIRCHNANQTPDPLSLPGQAVIGDFDHDSLSDFGGVEMSLISSPVLMTNQIKTGMMPPPPAAKLADWQIDTIVNWLNEKPPM